MKDKSRERTRITHSNNKQIINDLFPNHRNKEHVLRVNPKAVTSQNINRVNKQQLRK